MNFVNPASARPRPLLSAAFAGAGLGLGLGALFMAGGLGRAALDHNRAERIAEAARGGYSDAALNRQLGGLGPDALRLVRDADPARAAAFDNRDIAAVDPAAARRGPRDPVQDLNCLTQAVYFEARGETPRGQAAVAQVVLNRVKSPVFPKTVCAVVYQGAPSRRCQFSFACDGSMRHGLEADAWDRARQVASRALSGVVAADIGSATHFHTTSVDPSPYGEPDQPSTPSTSTGRPVAPSAHRATVRSPRSSAPRSTPRPTPLDSPSSSATTRIAAWRGSTARRRPRKRSSASRSFARAPT